MAVKNKTRYAILGVLTIADRSGYDIKKYCDKILSHVWHENYGHIYPMLKRMEEEGAILRTDDPGAPRKVLYRISAKGLEEFRQWLAEPVDFHPARSELLLKLSFANNQPVRHTAEMIGAYKVLQQSHLAEYREMERYLAEDPQAACHAQRIYVLAPLRYGILAAEAAVEWCDEVLDMLREAGQSQIAREESGL